MDAQPEGTPTKTRFPRRVYQCGTEPDARFSLANERTFLAGMSTGLALLSVGVALESFGVAMEPHLRLAASLLLITLGILTPIQAWVSWSRVERALRLGRPLPSLFHGAALAAALALVGILVLIGVLVA